MKGHRITTEPQPSSVAGGLFGEFGRRCARRLRCRASSARHESAVHATAGWPPSFVQSAGASRQRSRSGLAYGTAVWTTGPRIGGIVRAATARPCLVSIDFFTVATVTMTVLFVLIVLEHRHREVLHFNVTAHPTAAWTSPADRRGLRLHHFRICTLRMWHSAARDPEAQKRALLLNPVRTKRQSCPAWLTVRRAVALVWANSQVGLGHCTPPAFGCARPRSGDPRRDTEGPVAKRLRVRASVHYTLVGRLGCARSVLTPNSGKASQGTTI
jgi:hypothetical protein